MQLMTVGHSTLQYGRVHFCTIHPSAENFAGGAKIVYFKNEVK